MWPSPPPPPPNTQTHTHMRARTVVRNSGNNFVSELNFIVSGVNFQLFEDTDATSVILLMALNFNHLKSQCNNHVASFHVSFNFCRLI